MSQNSKLLMVLGQGKGVSTHARDVQSIHSAKIFRDAQAVNFRVLNSDNRIISYISEQDLLEEKILNYLNFHVDFTLQNRGSRPKVELKAEFIAYLLARALI